ncbi:MAG: DUF2281 domain-containing protein [Acidobacteria bacterium]|jgi:hypothetical protein|nr:DUF2281 domain-containing protein [Acidobacteriota bacterium]
MSVCSINNIKKKIIVSLDTLPPGSLQEVINFLEYMRFKSQKKNQMSTPYKPIAFGGLWKDENIDDQDIDEVRREMWQSLDSREL